jgi:hypothetical protein
VQNVNTSDQEEYQVDSGGQKTGATVKGNNVNDNKANKVEKGQAEVLEVPSAAEKAAEDHVQVASAVRKGNVNAVPSTTPQEHVTNTSSKPVQKQGAKGSAPEKQSPRRLKPPLEKTVEPKASDTEVKGGAPAGSLKTKVVGAPTEEKDPYSLEGAIDGLLEVGASTSPRSPPKVKKLAKNAEGEAAAIPIDEAPNKVRTKNEKVSNTVPSPERKKLLVLNVHGMLLDCSLLLDKNPNPSIRPTLRTKKRRVIFWPRLIDFLNKCFLYFEVAFWGSKSEVYMAEVVLAMLERMKDGSIVKPLFMWSTKQCEITKFEDRIPLEWGKPLRKIFWEYPNFNHKNTVIVDHKLCRLGGNEAANLIIPTAFYMEELKKLGDDKAFLRTCLWPQL